MTNRYRLSEYTPDEIREMTNGPLLWWLALQGTGHCVEESMKGKFHISFYMHWNGKQGEPSLYSSFYCGIDMLNLLNKWREAHRDADGTPAVEMYVRPDGKSFVSSKRTDCDVELAPDLATAIARFVALNPVRQGGEGK